MRKNAEDYISIMVTLLGIEKREIRKDNTISIPEGEAICAGIDIAIDKIIKSKFLLED